jgi:hypothetical protein
MGIPACGSAQGREKYRRVSCAAGRAARGGAIDMKLWMAAEADFDVIDAFREARKNIEDKINVKLIDLPLENPFEKWAFIAMIRSEGDWANEVAKKNLKNRVLEFRLKIDHGEFIKGDSVKHEELLLMALRRSVDWMEKSGISGNDRNLLYSILPMPKESLIASDPNHENIPAPTL